MLKVDFLTENGDLIKAQNLDADFIRVISYVGKVTLDGDYEVDLITCDANEQIVKVFLKDTR